MKVGILAAGTSPDELVSQHGSYADMVQDLLQRSGVDAEFCRYEVRLDEFPAGADACDAWVITGSKHNVDEGTPWIARLESLVLEIVAARKPLAGICFGHQIIAQALGGKVERFDGGWGLGLQEYALLDTGLLDTGEASSFSINAIHQYQVVEKPESAEVFATSDFCRYAGLVYGDRIVTLQAHPEFQSDFEQALLQLRKGAVFSDADADKALASLDLSASGTDSDRVGHWLARLMMTAE
ncbi:glutamine amidotransferase-related protein [Marinobacterium stanieri]|uniref:glutamine amidotransferase-related protein n=1 Tax=Marinobacterium stanieri TaxID=49186 RepID=UPI003A93FA36